MIHIPLPENETARLKALHQFKILDTVTETAFDDITRIAAYICGTPTALISLIDSDRQWFKSKVGMDATQTTRDIAFCAHTIGQSDVFIVPDTLIDKRFASNPLVTAAPHIRFYAGVPLITAEGYAVGALGVMDYVPRELTKEQIEAQRLLGRQVVRQIELKSKNEKLINRANELEQRNREISLLSKMRDALQACLKVEEAYAAIAQFLQLLFPQTSGGIFLRSGSNNLVSAVTTWSPQSVVNEKLLIPYEWWGLQRGWAYSLKDAHSVCQHLHQNQAPSESVCIPMMAQGEVLGILYLSSQEVGQLTESKQQLAATVSEHIALTLTNIELRETLQNQSIRDSLTGLFNRRYMEASLERELERCDRTQQPLSIIMLDVDYFKRFNDTFGHDAGDAVLRELSQFLQRYVRGSDIACRYGGEEFTLILPEASDDVSYQRAEQIREGIKHVSVQHHHQPLGTITISVGVASFPKHGLTKEAVFQAADAALYLAKNSGRDAVRLAP